jgi:hypothetical protein
LPPITAHDGDHHVTIAEVLVTATTTTIITTPHYHDDRHPHY